MTVDITSTSTSARASPVTSMLIHTARLSTAIRTSPTCITDTSTPTRDCILSVLTDESERSVARVTVADTPAAA